MPDDSPALVVVAVGGLGAVHPQGVLPGRRQARHHPPAGGDRRRGPRAGRHRLPPLLRAVRRLGPLRARGPARPATRRVREEIGGVGPARVVIVSPPYYEQFAAWARYAHEVPAAVPAGLSVLNGADHTGTAPGWIGIEFFCFPTS